MSGDTAARQSGGFFYHQRPGEVHPAACDPNLQDRLLEYCRQVSGVALT